MFWNMRFIDPDVRQFDEMLHSSRSSYSKYIKSAYLHVFPGAQNSKIAIPNKMLVKKIELKVPLFRMYATLRMMVTRLTADVYKTPGWSLFLH